MATPHTHALPRAAALRRVPPSPSPIPSTIPLVPSWRERLARFWSGLWARPSPSPASAGRWSGLEGDALMDLSPRLLADIGAPEALRERALRERERRDQRLLELEQGHRAYQDVRW